jgi:hypothetical protein
MFNRPMTLTLVGVLAVAAMFLPLVPEPYRVFNFAAFGGLGLFAAARLGFWPGVAVVVLAKLASDVLNFASHGFDPNYLPIWYVIGAFGVYALCGRLVRRTEHPLAVGGAAAAGSVAFFLVTNFGSWVRQDLPYGYTLDGLWDCYAAGLPFYRGTFFGDVLVSVWVFTAHAVLSRAYFPTERVAVATVPVTK